MMWLFEQKALRGVSGKRWLALVYPWGVATAFDDGSAVRGTPPDDEHFAKSASDLGYGSDTYHHLVEHELCHSIVSEHLFGTVSRSLWAQAHNGSAHEGPMPPPARLEEEIVGNLQAALNGRPWGIDRLGKDAWIIQAALPLIRPSGLLMTSAWAGRS